MAIEYGMSVDEFWKDDPDLFWAYRFSYYNRVKRDREIANYDAWLQGAYFFEAISVALNNAFSKNKIEYHKQPYSIDDGKDNIEEKTESKVEMQVADVKTRISQINKIKCGTTEGKNKGGEIKNG